MKLVLRRMNSTGVIIGDLAIDGVHECFTLEDPDSANDRIAACTYKVIIDASTRFKRRMPHIIGSAAIDDRGIRIHAGNTEADTVGCILVGQEHTANALQLSKVAFDLLFAKLEAALARGETVILEVVAYDPTALAADATHIPQALVASASRPSNKPSLLDGIYRFLLSILQPS